MSYAGNKRNEIKLFYDSLDFVGVDTIVEPFCGSCAMSYYIWTQKPTLKFLLNDNNIFLKEMYEIIKDDKKCEEFENNFNKLVDSFTGNKEKYLEIVNKQKTLYGWFIANKIYCITAGLFPPQTRPYKKTIKFSDFPIYNFFRNANIIFTNEDGLEFYKTHCKVKNNLLLIDPPYINTCNNFYTNAGLNIYEYFYINDIKKENAKIYLILEDIWIIKLLFKNHKILNSYDKLYQGNKKKTNHIVITNQ